MRRAAEKNGNGQPDLRPKVRFPEFREDGAWHTETIGEISDPIKEKVGEHKITPVSITAGVGFVPQADKFGRDISGEQYKNYTYLRRGDFAYNKGNSKSFPQGYVCQLHEFEEVAASSAFICFKLNDGYEPTFLKGLFDRNTHGRQLSAHITSGARSNGLLNLNAGHFYGVQLPFPPNFEEQERIAECLDSIDALIQAEIKKLDALKDHKQGLMQQLFPAEGESLPKLRFPEFSGRGVWSETTLKSAIHLISGLHLSPTDYSDSGAVPYFTGPSDFTHNVEQVTKWTDKTTNAANAGDILVTVKGSGVGELWDLAFPKVALGRQLMAVRSHACEKPFLFQFLQTRRSEFVAMASGNLIPGLSRNDILGIKLCLPQPDEQKAISKCLSSIDSLISSQGSTVDGLKKHRQGLLQQLFPVLDEVEG